MMNIFSYASFHLTCISLVRCLWRSLAHILIWLLFFLLIFKSSSDILFFFSFFLWGGVSFFSLGNTSSDILKFKLSLAICSLLMSPSNTSVGVLSLEFLSLMTLILLAFRFIAPNVLYLYA